MAAFWFVLTLSALAWYASATVLVAVKGARDIRAMLARLDQGRQDSPRS